MRCGSPPSDLDAKMDSTLKRKDAHIRTNSTQTVSGMKDNESSESTVDWGLRTPKPKVAGSIPAGGSVQIKSSLTLLHDICYQS